MTKKVYTKKKIRLISESLVVVGLIGVLLSFATAKMHAKRLDEQIADYQQKQGTFDQFIAGQISFSKFVHTFDEDDWQSILNKEGQNFVVQQWALASSLIVTLSGGLVLSWFFSIWFVKSFAGFSSELFARFSVLWRKIPFCSALTTRFSKKRFGGLCWTSNDVMKQNGRTGSRLADTDSTATSGSEQESRQPLQQTEVQTPISQRRFQKVSCGQAVKPQQQKLSTADIPAPSIAEPISVLKDLSDHVFAIREYATLQQGRMEKLQDGYDWNIIRTFCLRIIRCIDNIDARIKVLMSKSCDVSDLREVHDELVFALESSGVERFAPQINSDYCGQEKKLEAIKEKVPCEDPALNGKVAEVVRCGFCYLIEDDNLKIIRPSQVKLFG